VSTTGIEIDVRNVQQLPVERGLVEAAARASLELGAADGERSRGGSQPVQVSILLTNDAHIAELNREYRSVDEPTDVLAFPQLPGDAGEPPCGAALGDVVVSVERAYQQAAEAGRSPATEICELVAHGVLHLLGLADDAGNALIVGCVIFLRPGRWETRLGEIATGSRVPEAGEQFLLVASGVAFLVLCIIVIKGMTQRGTVLSGGVVSGHSALAFFVATCVLFLTGNWGVAGLAFALALLISQSRVQGRIHTLEEAVLGAILGTAVGTLIFTLGMAF